MLGTKLGIKNSQISSANSLQEFLNHLIFRSQCWCIVSCGNEGGFRVAANDAILFYAMLSGSASLSTTLGENISLERGDVAAVIDQRAHLLRFGETGNLEDLSFLNNAQYLDSPVKIIIGNDDTYNKILCGRLKVRWPGDIRAANLPPVIKVPAANSLMKADVLVNVAQGRGGASILTNAAAAVLIGALSQHPECQRLFRSHSLRNPVEHAIQLMEDKPSDGWTVSSLAHRVGIGRSAFAARFLAEVGKTPIEMLIDLRMQLARNLLKTTNLTISEVAEKVGYHSESAFHKRFTTYFKITPARMRR